MNINISVILPFYNVEDYIGECIESLKAQTLNGLEFIFVDDCSTDSSIKYVENFAANDDRVRIIRNQQNMGAGRSRNVGIAAAKGKYLSFIDPDDQISPDFYIQLFVKALVTDADIVKGMCLELDGDNITGKSKMNALLKKNIKHGIPVFCNFSYEHTTALYKRTLFSNPLARYGSTAYGEDTTFLLRILYGAKKTAIENSALYYYRIRHGSAFSTYSIRRCVGEVRSLKDKLDFLLQQPQDQFSRIYIRNRLRYCLRSVCLTIDQDRLLKQNDNSPSYDDSYKNLVSTYKSELKEQLNRLPSSVLSVKFLEEVIIFLRYGEFIPTSPKFPGKRDEWRVNAWTNFLICHPDADPQLLRGYVYMMITSFADSLNKEWNDPKQKTPYVVFLYKQYKQLNKSLRAKVIPYLPGCIASYVIRTFKSLLFGMNE